MIGSWRPGCRRGPAARSVAGLSLRAHPRRLSGRGGLLSLVGAPPQPLQLTLELAQALLRGGEVSQRTARELTVSLPSAAAILQFDPQLGLGVRTPLGATARPLVA